MVCGQLNPQWAEVASGMEDFIRERVRGAGANGVVFGLSGGVDSAVVAHLCARALNKERCMALLMPNDSFTPSSETKDGILVATNLAIHYQIIPIQSISDAATTHDTDRPEIKRRATGNLNARIRAALLYYEAQKRQYLVVGTSDRSEYMMGYFTKYGDGACDMLPIVSLYKTQVQRLARFLQVPSHIIEKEPSPHLWNGHKSVDELGLRYDAIDAILMNDHTTLEGLHIPPDKIEHIRHLVRTSEHKRHMPAAMPTIHTPTDIPP